ncbi:hypothetical protein J6590_071711 [Homalodisca vitripennis]|nr:hypothetical protein J6590_071710 [Homalodisca vitripennis]KAG8285881.1 hypothetical protein J6590_071711 [Homalodisca vitripennis]
MNNSLLARVRLPATGRSHLGRVLNNIFDSGRIVVNHTRTKSGLNRSFYILLHLYEFITLVVHLADSIASILSEIQSCRVRVRMREHRAWRVALSLGGSIHRLTDRKREGRWHGGWWGAKVRTSRGPAVDGRVDPTVTTAIGPLVLTGS